MNAAIRVLILGAALLGLVHCSTDDPLTILREDFDLTGEWSVGLGNSMSWSCSG